MRSEVGYYYPPEQPMSDWDRYYNGFEQWVNDNYDMATETIRGIPVPWDEAFSDESLLEVYIDIVNRSKEI